MAAAPLPPALPPGPPLPGPAQTLALVAAPEPFLRLCRERYGDVFSLDVFGAGRFVLVCDPAAIKQIFTSSGDVLRAGEANAPLGAVLGQRSVLLLDGAEHLRHRRMLLPPFHGERMRAYEPIMEAATVRAMRTWPVGRPFALLPSMQAITLEVILRAVFGLHEGAGMDRLAAALRALLDPTVSRLRLLLVALTGGTFEPGAAQERFAEQLADVDRLLYAEIARRRADPGLGLREDILSMLLLARDAEGEAMSDVEVRDELMTLLVAGHETTATALAWTFERLLRHPGARERVEEELADDEHAYLDACLKESLRVRPVLPSVGRVLAEPREIGGYRLPAGTMVAPSITLTHRRDDAFPDPEAFRPDRFLGARPPDTYSWIPFGGGPRRCLGASFALYEMRTVVRTVLEQVDLEPVGDPAGEAVSRRALTLVPADGARVVRRA